MWEYSEENSHGSGKPWKTMEVERNGHPRGNVLLPYDFREGTCHLREQDEEPKRLEVVADHNKNHLCSAVPVPRWSPS